MEKNKNSQILVIAVLSFAILFMSVGFAQFSSKLNINGTATVKANKWSVHFVNNSYKETTGSVEATNKSVTNTDFTFNVTLAKPKDFYEATVNVINDGTFDANLTALTMSTLTEAQKKYLTYTVTYDGTAYTSSASGLSNLLPYNPAGEANTKSVKVRLEYIQPDSSDDLPKDADVDVTLTASLDYTQVQ